MLNPEELAKLASQSEVNVLVFSDSHGSAEFILRTAAGHPEADLAIHLGDHCDKLADLASRCPVRLTGVAGNCDGWTGRHLPNQQLIVLAGQRVFFTHGHLYKVKQQLAAVLAAGAEKPNLADVILFGHTHQYLEKTVDWQGRPILLLNPGCSRTGLCGPPASALLLQLQPGQLVCRLLLDQT
jgi:putative phosphoesterase